jgi:ATP-dependent Clp protease ATP-binding subunit ClpC
VTMFERYTEKARRVIFFARYEASQFGSPYIETEHLLLGLLREDKALTNRFLRSHASVELIRKQIETHTTIGEKVSTSVDLPLSNEGKRVLAYAAEEAERLGHKHIGTEHLLLGLLREEGCFAAELLKDRGVKLESVRDDVARVTHEPEARPSAPGAAPPSLAEISRDLTQAAIEGQLGPVLGRDLEIEGVIEVLSNLQHGNPLLVGESGAGKTAIVEALAQRIVEGTVPAFLMEKRVLVFDAQLAAGRQILREQLQSAARPGSEGIDMILFAGDLRSLLSAGSAAGWTSGWLRGSPLQGRMRCIVTSTPADYKECMRAAPWFKDSFRVVYVRSLGLEETLNVLKARKQVYEKFHVVSYSEEALEFAAKAADSYLPDRALPGKAFELLDAAAARVKMRQGALPDEVLDVQKRIRFIVHRMDSAIANHEFEKARFYSDEERKERENLRILREKHSLDEAPSNEVSRGDLEEVIARWSIYPFRPWEEA